MFEENEVKSSLSRFISGCIVIVILLFMVPISHRLPGSSKVILTSHSYGLEIYHLKVAIMDEA